MTKAEQVPDPARELPRAFDYYHHLEGRDRGRYRPRFGAAGKAAATHFVTRLSDPRLAIRKTAWELLTRLVAKPLLFDPAATPGERAMMLPPIATWVRSADLHWNGGRFVVR